MKRRDFLKKAAVGAVAAGTAPAVLAQSKKKIRWRMASSFPKAFDIIFSGAETIAERVKAMSGGQFEIIPYAAGELVGGARSIRCRIPGHGTDGAHRLLLLYR